MRMVDAQIGFCCTFVSPEGDGEEQRALNMRQPTVDLAAHLREREPEPA